ncbi:WGR domain-containing protein [Leptospira borgpetersenii]|uniref:WGR domain protein n=1 Tax=Leptospira borgpetersenii str. 200801926 TaxID=1193009 RepID=A0ABP2S1K1_LEPBO|nr:WGR domain-containing protein [Leptospira borgpetersenii]EKP12853.1 WGR domain protein [Leptospira borgpetersenii str. 200801926]ENO63471.1 WGR domain protein [Leptospira borgpetersenii serovar Mini str. 201000851]
MKKHFIHSENGSEIFWQIEISGLSLILSFGKIGNTIGKRSIRNFKTGEECFKEFQKLIDQKSILGFKESDRVPSFKALSGNADYLTTWNAVLEAPDRKKALRSHFEILTETEECAAVLDQIVSKIEEIYIENDQFVFTLPWHYDEETKVHIRWNAPYIGRIHSSVPHSMAKFVTNFNGVSFHHDNDDLAITWVLGVEPKDKEKSALVVGDGGWEKEILEKGDDWWIVPAPLEILEQCFGDIQCFGGAFDNGQQIWYVFHPFIKNKFGELAVTTIDHESCELEPTLVGFGIGGFILREIANWILGARKYDSGQELTLSGSPVVTQAFQEFLAHKAVAISKNHPEIAKRLLEFDWHLLSSSIHGTISNWVGSLAKKEWDDEKILVIDSYWDDAGEVIFLGLDWHSGVDYEDAISEGANEIEYILDFTSFYKSVLGKNRNEELDGSEVVKILEDDYSITRDILAYLSIQNLVSVANGEDFQKLPLDEKGIYIAYSHYHDEEAEVAYHPAEGIKKEFFKSLFSTEGKNKKEREVPEEEQELIDDIVGDVMENYPWIWKDTIEKSMNRLAENFQENKERYQREFNKILEYKEKVDEEEKTALSDLGMQMSSAALNRFLRENKPDAAKWVLQCYSNIYRSLEINGNSTLTGNETGNSYNTAEYFAGDIIVFITKYGDGKYLSLLEDLLPSDIQDARLAFNLACLNSLEKNKENVLRYTKLALSLGKPKKDFEDSDFDNFKDDPEFHSLVVLH